MESIKEKLLIIDDDEAMIKLYLHHLKKHFTIFSQTIASEGIKAAIAEKPHIILLDLHMPNVDGFEVLLQLRSNPTTAHLPVICMSADSSEATRMRANQLGAIGFIKKPPVYQQLAGDIRSLIDSLNPIIRSVDHRRQFKIAFNENEKDFIIQTDLEKAFSENKKVVLLTWQDGQEYLQHESFMNKVRNNELIILKIKPTLITKFPFMQELGGLIQDIQKLVTVSTNEYILMIDEPNHLFIGTEINTSVAKVFTLNELFSKNFSETNLYSLKQWDLQKEAQMQVLARNFVA